MHFNAPGSISYCAAVIDDQVYGMRFVLVCEGSTGRYHNAVPFIYGNSLTCSVSTKVGTVQIESDFEDFQKLRTRQLTTTGCLRRASYRRLSAPSISPRTAARKSWALASQFRLRPKCRVASARLKCSSAALTSVVGAFGSKTRKMLNMKSCLCAGSL